MRRRYPSRPGHRRPSVQSSSANSLKHWSEICSIASSLATTAAFVLALWAYFFSSLPEKLTERFNSEIVGLNTQLTELRLERISIHQQNDAARSELTAAIEEKNNAVSALENTRRQLEEQINGYLEEKNQLELQLQTLRSENLDNSRYRDQYLKDTAAMIFGITFTLGYMKEDTRTSSYLEMAADYPQYIKFRDYFSQNPSVDNSTFLENLFGSNRNAVIANRMSEIRERHKLLPNSWLTVSMAEWCRDCDEKDTAEAERKFLEWVHADDLPLTGLDLIKSRVESRRETLLTLPREDLIKINHALEAFYKNNAEILALPLHLNLEEQASPEQIATAGSKILDNWKKISLVFLGIGDELPKFIR